VQYMCSIRAVYVQYMCGIRAVYVQYMCFNPSIVFVTYSTVFLQLPAT
jgi:hypothetical protein